LAALPCGSARAGGESLDRPFAGFETHHLPNGFRIWYKPLTVGPDVSLCVIVPYGSDRDPHGKEELAHFTEHMLFSDHLGKTEEEVKAEIENLGGRRNGITTWDHTFYYVTIDKQHGMLALDWLHRVVSPHAMEPAIVERSREPVALEKGIRPRQLFDYVGAYYLDPAVLRLPSFWKREFGLPTRRDRGYDPFTSLYSITPEDLRRFHETYYVPGRMTLVVVGDLDREAVLRQARATFGAWPARPEPPGHPELRNPRRPRRWIGWEFRGNVRYDTKFKIYGMTREDHLRLLFVDRLLERRLKHRLRFGEQKAVYGVNVGVRTFGPAAYLGIHAEIDDAKLDFASGVIEEELELLRRASIPVEEFEIDRQAITARLVRENRAPQDLVFWAARDFHDPDLHDDFPDVGAFFADVSQAELAELAAAHLTEENRVHQLLRPQPLSQGIFSIYAVLVVLAVVTGARKLWVRPVEMRRIRYLARLRRPVLYRVFVTPLWCIGIAVLFRLAYAVLERFVARFVAPVDLYLFQWSVFALIFAGSILAFILLWGAAPVKILVFEDHVRIKLRAYRSRIVPLDRIASVSIRRFGDLRRRGRLLRTRLLALGILEPAVHLELDDGHGYFFRVRDNRELVDCIGALLADRKD
jgi:predicted Zn-dependent peptidase